jgi:hypothetical protein
MSDPTPLPDHPIRRHVLWQAFDRLWRPAAGWTAVIGTFYAGGLGHLIGRPMAEAYLALWLAFVAAVLGLKSIEKFRGAA